MTTARTPAARPAWIIIGGLGLLAVYLWALDGLVADLFWDAFVATILAIGIVAVWRMPRQRRAWLWIFGGQVSFLLGDLGFNYVVRYSDSESLYSFADIFYLTGYPLMAVGLVLLLRVQGPSKDDLGGLIDGAIVAVGTGVVLWVFLMAPTAGDSTLTLLDRMIGCAYPAGDLLLITIGAQIAVRKVRRGASFWLLTGSLLAMLAADVGYMYLTLHTTYTAGSFIDAGWWLGYVLIVAAAVHPDAVRLADPLLERHQPRLRVRRLLVLGAVTLAAPALLTVRAGFGKSLETPALLGGTMVMFALVVLRLGLVTRELEDSRMRLLYEATHDSLTGLANRVVFADRVNHALAQRQPAGSDAVGLCIDLDDLKVINDSFGHAAGDRLLRVVGERLSALMRPGDTVARLGGDEFAILLESVPVDAVAAVAQRVNETIREPLDVGTERRVFANASIGVAYGQSYDDVDALMRDADIAMYLAKRRGKGRHEVFEPGMRQQVIERLELRVELVDALDRGEISVRYQPVIDVDSRQIHGFEALLRWDHPTRGEVQPAQFISIAEESLLLVPIGRWVLEEACRQAQTWDPSPGGPQIAVNVSPAQLCDASFVDDVGRALDRSGLAPDRLLLELTESSLIDDPENAADAFVALRGMGVRAGLDGFGSGHTSLEQLRRLPVDVVKFDRGFVTSSFAGNSSVLRGLIEFAHKLGIESVGVGVETHDQLEQLASMGCRYAQGYFIARPLSAADAQRLVAERVESGVGFDDLAPSA